MEEEAELFSLTLAGVGWFCRHGGLVGHEVRMNPSATGCSQHCAMPEPGEPGTGMAVDWRSVSRPWLRLRFDHLDFQGLAVRGVRIVPYHDRGCVGSSLLVAPGVGMAHVQRICGRGQSCADDVAVA